MRLLRAGEQQAAGPALPRPALPLPALPQWRQRVSSGPHRRGQRRPGRDADERALPSLERRTAKMVTSELCPPQLKKGNKEPNPMVQLSTQDATQESKVTAGTRAPLREASRAGTAGGMKRSL